MNILTFELKLQGKVVGYEYHQLGTDWTTTQLDKSIPEKRMIGIYHTKTKGVCLSLITEHNYDYIKHDEKLLLTNG